MAITNIPTKQANAATKDPHRFPLLVERIAIIPNTIYPTSKTNLEAIHPNAPSSHPPCITNVIPLTSNIVSIIWGAILRNLFCNNSGLIKESANRPEKLTNEETIKIR